MELGYIFIVGCSLTFLFAVALYAVRNIRIAGSKAFFLQIILVTIWSVGSLLEMLSTTEAEMLLWRNIEQIGVFLLPVACVYFAVDYARYDKLKRYLPLLLVIPLIAIFLIFTDSSTHIMRTGYSVSYSPLFGKALSVHQTITGVLFVSYNYLLVSVALAILFVFSRQVSKGMRRQVILVLIATALVFLLGFIKSAFLEGTRVNLPIVTMYLPGSLILFYNLYRNDFFSVSPIARDKVFDVIELGIVVTDSSGTITDMNPWAENMLNECFSIKKRLNGETMETAFCQYPAWVTLTRACADGETELQIENAPVCYLHIRVYPLQSQKGAAIGSVSIMRDVTAMRMQQIALMAKAATDSLTGLLNRESFLEMFAENLRQSFKSGTRVSVLMMDLDKFKLVNDTYGHDHGDHVLRAVSDVLKDVLRHEDAIARIGGDEFAAVLPGVGKKEAAEIARRILDAAGKKVIRHESAADIPLKLSIGVCDNETVSSAEEMLKCADKAMYQAKSNLGNCCVEWE